MSDHSIVYDLQRPANGTLECHAAPDAMCHAVFDCDCEGWHDFHVVNGVPHHYSTYDDGYTVRTHCAGRFDPGECHLREWHENSDEDVTGEVRVSVKADWCTDYVVFHATAAELSNTTRSPEGATS